MNRKRLTQDVSQARRPTPDFFTFLFGEPWTGHRQQVQPGTEVPGLQDEPTVPGCTTGRIGCRSLCCVEKNLLGSRRPVGRWASDPTHFRVLTRTDQSDVI